ncbi:sarcosine oxidase subunit gamma [Zavarzinia compransoris]|uniref:Sarcosine oxidase subunit gamma n=1 Tax=Zavarzinia compransoris TaxID=1264899 RepID=A0A317E2Q6_9PROT|nr:sarcosine oxidase subunit gamma family protein [Zavarzinia compransoris]PWR19663.1 hypothetical protein DKG75_14425 [Zavarzinia compransoris]TDP43395.1 N-methylglutamate dehydrogenase subunit D [Zavarzinia compransoris]
MVEIAARSAFAGLLHPIGPAPARLTVAERADLGLAAVALRPGGRDELARRLRARHGLTLPAGPRATFAPGTALIATGPSTFLLARDGGIDAEALGDDLAGCATVTDQSDGYGVLRLSGPGTFETLAKGIAVDFHPVAFGPGGAAVTSCAHMGVIPWQVDAAPTVEIAVFRSLAGSFWDFLAASGAAGGIAV